MSETYRKVTELHGASLEANIEGQTIGSDQQSLSLLDFVPPEAGGWGPPGPSGRFVITVEFTADSPREPRPPCKCGHDAVAHLDSGKCMGCDEARKAMRCHEYRAKGKR